MAISLVRANRLLAPRVRCCGSTYLGVAASFSHSYRARVTTLKKSLCWMETGSSLLWMVNVTNGFQARRSCRMAARGIFGCCTTRITRRPLAPGMRLLALYPKVQTCLRRSRVRWLIVAQNSHLICPGDPVVTEVQLPRRSV